MAAAIETPPPNATRVAGGSADVTATLALGAGLLALFGPTWWDLLFGIWVSYSQGHEPLVLAAALFLAWRRREAWSNLPARQGLTWPGAALLALGLALYYLGRTQQLIRVEFLSQWLVIGALILHLRGGAGLRVLALPMAFALFAVPLPYGLVLALTGPLKSAVSVLTVEGLQSLGYPVGRSGVVITIGQYQLLVAEACAGLQTMFALEAVGLFYTQLMNYTSWQRNVLMGVLVVPVAFGANVVRTATLVLVTYYFGDDVGQGFVHGFAGILLFAVALLFIHALDRVLDRYVPRHWR